MSAWFKQATVAGVAALSLALFSGGQLAAAAPTTSPSPSSSESSSAPTSPAPSSPTPDEAPAAESEAPASSEQPADAPTTEAPTTEAPAESEAPSSEAPASSEAPSASVTPSESASAEPSEKREVGAAAAQFNLTIGGSQECIPLGSETVTRTFSLVNNGSDPATATISVAGPVDFSLGTHDLSAGEDAGEIGSEELPAGDYTVTFAFEGQDPQTSTFAVEACESPITFASIEATCATINDGAVNGTIANTQDATVTVGVRVAGTDQAVSVEVPAGGEQEFTLAGLAPGDHVVEIVGTIDDENVTVDSATATVKNCITLVSVESNVCAGPDQASMVTWTVRNDGEQAVSIGAAEGDANLSPLTVPAGQTASIDHAGLPAGDHSIDFTVELEGETRALDTAAVTVEECPVVDVNAEVALVDCFNGNASFDNSGSNVPVTFRVWDGDTKVAEVEVAAGKSATKAYEFTGRQLKVTAEGADVSREVLTADYTETCAALVKPIQVKAECNQVTFTSPAGNGAVLVQYGDMEQEKVDDQFNLAGGASTTVDTSRTEIDWVAFTDVNGEQIIQGARGLAVEDCATPSPSPSESAPSTEAPQPPAEAPDAPELAETGSSASLLSVLLGAGLLVAGAGAIALGRRRA